MAARLDAYRHLDNGGVAAARQHDGVARLVLVLFDGDAEVVQRLPRPLVRSPVGLGDGDDPGGVEDRSGVGKRSIGPLVAMC
jgi:hypothetical protein